jgi:hypothetical protein
MSTMSDYVQARAVCGCDCKWEFCTPRVMNLWLTSPGNLHLTSRRSEEDPKFRNHQAKSSMRTPTTFFSLLVSRHHTQITHITSLAGRQSRWHKEAFHHVRHIIARPARRCQTRMLALHPLPQTCMGVCCTISDHLHQV